MNHELGVAEPGVEIAPAVHPLDTARSVTAFSLSRGPTPPDDLARSLSKLSLEIVGQSERGGHETSRLDGDRHRLEERRYGKRTGTASPTSERTGCPLESISL